MRFNKRKRVDGVVKKRKRSLFGIKLGTKLRDFTYKEPSNYETPFVSHDPVSRKGVRSDSYLSPMGKVIGKNKKRVRMSSMSAPVGRTLNFDDMVEEDVNVEEEPVRIVAYSRQGKRMQPKYAVQSMQKRLKSFMERKRKASESAEPDRVRTIRNVEVPGKYERGIVGDVLTGASNIAGLIPGGTGVSAALAGADALYDVVRGAPMSHHLTENALNAVPAAIGYGSKYLRPYMTALKDYTYGGLGRSIAARANSRAVTHYRTQKLERDIASIGKHYLDMNRGQPGLAATDAASKAEKFFKAATRTGNEMQAYMGNMYMAAANGIKGGMYNVAGKGAGWVASTFPRQTGKFLLGKYI
jgi:hypothetical protein